MLIDPTGADCLSYTMLASALKSGTWLDQVDETPAAVSTSDHQPFPVISLFLDICCLHGNIDTQELHIYIYI